MLLNGFDCLNPKLYGVEGSANPIERLKELCGRPVGANLEPVDLEAEMLETRLVIPAGRICSKETLKSAEALGLDFICLTGNSWYRSDESSDCPSDSKSEKIFYRRHYCRKNAWSRLKRTRNESRNCKGTN